MSENNLAGAGGAKVTNADTAVKEADLDAASIKEKKTGKEAYEAFKSELDDIQKTVGDEGLRKQYREKLTANLGDDVNRLLAPYLQDSLYGGKMKDAGSGEITQANIDKRGKAIFMYNIEANEVDKALLPKVDMHFDSLKDINKNDGSSSSIKNNRGITESDLTGADKKETEKAQKDEMTKANISQKYAETLLDPANNYAFTAAEKTYWSGEDGRMSKSNIDSFLKKADAHNGGDKNGLYPPQFIDKLRAISGSWNSEQVNAMKDSNGYLTRDSIAKGNGFENYNSFLVEREKVKVPTEGPKEGPKEAPKEAPKDKGALFTQGEYETGIKSFTYDASGRLTEIKDQTATYSVRYSEDGKNSLWVGEKQTEFTDVSIAPNTGTIMYKNGKGETQIEQVKKTGNENVLAPENKILNKQLIASATQETGQGYWQIAEKMLKSDSSEAATVQEKTILMRALQELHREQKGALANHPFLTTQADLDSLNKKIEQYAKNSKQPNMLTSATSLRNKISKLESAKQ